MVGGESSRVIRDTSSGLVSVDVGSEAASRGGSKVGLFILTVPSFSSSSPLTSTPNPSPSKLPSVSLFNLSSSLSSVPVASPLHFQSILNRSFLLALLGRPPSSVVVAADLLDEGDPGFRNVCWTGREANRVDGEVLYIVSTSLEPTMGSWLGRYRSGPDRVCRDVISLDCLNADESGLFET